MCGKLAYRARFLLHFLPNPARHRVCESWQAKKLVLSRRTWSYPLAIDNILPTTTTQSRKCCHLFRKESAIKGPHVCRTFPSLIVRPYIVALQLCLETSGEACVHYQHDKKHYCQFNGGRIASTPLPWLDFTVLDRRNVACWENFRTQCVVVQVVVHHPLSTHLVRDFRTSSVWSRPFLECTARRWWWIRLISTRTHVYQHMYVPVTIIMAFTHRPNHHYHEWKWSMNRVVDIDSHRFARMFFSPCSD